MGNETYTEQVTKINNHIKLERLVFTNEVDNENITNVTRFYLVVFNFGKEYDIIINSSRLRNAITSRNLVNIVSGCGLLPDGIKSLPELMLYYRQSNSYDHISFLLKMHCVSFKEMHFKMSPATFRLFCSGPNVLTKNSTLVFLYLLSWKRSPALQMGRHSV